MLRNKLTVLVPSITVSRFIEKSSYYILIEINWLITSYRTHNSEGDSTGRRIPGMKSRLVVGWVHESHVLICSWMRMKKKKKRISWRDTGNHSWCMGPQSIIDSCVYYHKSAVLARAFPSLSNTLPLITSLLAFDVTWIPNYCLRQKLGNSKETRRDIPKLDKEITA